MVIIKIKKNLFLGTIALDVNIPNINNYINGVSNNEIEIIKGIEVINNGYVSKKRDEKK